MNLYSMFHQNWTMGKCSNPRGKVRGKEGGGLNSGGGGEFLKYASITNAIRKSIHVASFIQIIQKESVKNQGENWR